MHLPPEKMNSEEIFKEIVSVEKLYNPSSEQIERLVLLRKEYKKRTDNKGGGHRSKIKF